ncbi:MAG: hypothetical protein K1566_00615 [Candidatus Thiodiazotropha sp. (ex. Lucinisca nassula)]|nr:hypothetical protein [Candidatus Thiodiazotropha sp. (ex. Lucinisca nassula)]MBW9260350.1 hypothetical protein [Candidatus Thiodiazotropha sp. (ex. Lucinisca nassula)]MBW9268121.1 hypothetical protein [Candidatus Thiodiazotropha sp. (ex. Lucinisca nassula)]
MSNRHYPLPRRLQDGSLDLAFYNNRALELRSNDFFYLLDRLMNLLRVLISS